MSEVITIEATSDKFKNKYSAGSVLANGKWMQVSSKLNLADFQKDSQVTVETKTNDKGYTSIVGLIKNEPIQTVERKPKREAVSQEADTTTATTPINAVMTEVSSKFNAKTYDENKSRKILVQGVTQAVLACPALAGLPFTTVEDIATNAKNLALEMIQFVDENSR